MIAPFCMEETEFELSIQSLAWEGWGVGRRQGKVVFVPYTAPGDVIRCAVTEDRGRFAFGTLVDLVRSSPARVSPTCPVFGRCGGCQWQQVAYERQLEAKRDILVDALVRIGGLREPVVSRTVASNRDYGWRTAVDLAYETGRGGARVGFFTRHGSEIVPIERCPVARDQINARIGLLSDAIGALGIGVGGQIRLVAGADDRVSAHLVPNEPMAVERRQAERFLSLAGLSGVEVTVRSATTTFGEPALSYPGWSIDREVPLACHPSGFVQANPAINRELIDRLLSFSFTGKQVLELYSGIGNLTIPLALAGARVTGVEADPASIKDARRTAQTMGLAGITFIPGDVKDVFSDRAVKRSGFDVVVLDPPRTGARPVMGAIAALGAADTFYISCWPPTLARDLAVLTGKGWRLVSAVPLDMFPQTFHVEALCHLIRG